MLLEDFSIDRFLLLACLILVLLTFHFRTDYVLKNVCKSSHFMLRPYYVCFCLAWSTVLHYQHLLENTLYHTYSLASNLISVSVNDFTLLSCLFVKSIFGVTHEGRLL